LYNNNNNNNEPNIVQNQSLSNSKRYSQPEYTFKDKSLLEEINRHVNSLNAKVDNYQDTLTNISRDISGMKSKIIEFESEFKNLKRDIAFTNERIDLISRMGNSTSKVVEQSKLFQNLTEMNSKTNSYLDSQINNNLNLSNTKSNKEDDRLSAKY